MKELRYDNIQRWIPPTDVDGIDVKPEMSSVLRNAILRNGFLTNAVDTVPQTLGENVQGTLDLGYEIIGYTNFNHSSKGFHEVYVLYNSSNKRLYLFVDDEVVTIDNTSGYVTCLTVPNNINFNLVNDELKINLNAKATILSKEVLLNISLQWLEEVGYVKRVGIPSLTGITFTGTGLDDLAVTGEETDYQAHTYDIVITEEGAGGEEDLYKWRIDGGDWSVGNYRCRDTFQLLTNGISVKFGAETGHTLGDMWSVTTVLGGGYVKPAGWFACPRWLGYIPTTDKVRITNSTPPTEFLIEDFEDNIFIGGLVLNSSPYPDWEREEGKLQIVHNGSGRTNPVYFRNFRNLKRIKMRLDMSGEVIFNLDLVNFSDGSIAKRIFNTSVTPGVSEYDKEVIIEVDEFQGRTFDLKLDATVSGYEGGSGVTFSSYIKIDSIEFFAHETIILGKYFNGSRALIGTGAGTTEKFGIDIFNPDPNIQVTLDKNYVDWRMTGFELYAKNTNDIYILKGKWSVDQTWTQLGNLLLRNLTFQEEDEAVETLNFNYGLGEGIRVDTQHLIYSEVSFNNRVYAVANSYLIYQSHIAGSGRIQPDSFPFSLEDNYGFIEEAKSNALLNLFIINNNYLLLFMKNAFSLYMIASNRGTLQKELRILASSFTGFNPKSLTRTITGISTTIGAYFVTNEGIFFHDGSLGSIPKNLILETHKIYWRTVEKTNFGFFDYQDNEYWYATKVFLEERDDPDGGGGREFTEFLVYEADYKTFRFVRLEKAFYDFAGYLDGIPLLRTNKKIEKLDKKNNKSLNAVVEMHYTNLGKDDYSKIAQYLLVSLKDKYQGDTVIIKANFDDQPITYSYTISTNEVRMLRLLPESVRFKKVKLSIVLGNVNKPPITISYFALGFTEDGIGAMGELPEHPKFEVAETGYGRAYGRYYGRN